MGVVAGKNLLAWGERGNCGLRRVNHVKWRFHRGKKGRKGADRVKKGIIAKKRASPCFREENGEKRRPPS